VQQLDLLESRESEPQVGPDLASYDEYVVFFSGGKDSIACVLHLLESGVPRERIVLHHHLVDGESGAEHLMDWPVTWSYCQAFAGHLGLRLESSYRKGGFEREMLRDEQRTAPVVFYRDGEPIEVGGVHGPLGTRRRFPQLSANLQVRWCSSALKIDVGAAYLRNHPRFANRRTLVVTGERAEESTARSRYARFEAHRADNRAGASRRHVDHWRAAHAWSEREVWAIMERHGINPHPAYRLGWGRVSCMTCIFGSPAQWATIRKLAPARFARIADLEADFGVTLHRSMPIDMLADKGKAYPLDIAAAQLALSDNYSDAITLNPWTLPSGAFAEGGGPT
jgi:3'-phosphoadenosine 5'-phosphosulfate sulfotransferase (PAPS reductase)/FAD synthetase